MMSNKKIDLAKFDFSEYQEDAIYKLRFSQSLAGKDGVLTTLIKEILESALESNRLLFIELQSPRSLFTYKLPIR